MRTGTDKEQERRQWSPLGLQVFWYDVTDTPGLEGEDEWVQVDDGIFGEPGRIVYQGPDGPRFSAFKAGFLQGQQHERRKGVAK